MTVWVEVEFGLSRSRLNVTRKTCCHGPEKGWPGVGPVNMSPLKTSQFMGMVLPRARGLTTLFHDEVGSRISPGNRVSISRYASRPSWRVYGTRQSLRSIAVIWVRYPLALFGC
jgi:hypothetical protein